MSDARSDQLGAPPVAFRAILGALGLIQFVNGLTATISPTYFYEQFPLGRGWVEALPAYNEHLMRDVGALFLATGAVVLAAAWFLGRRLVAIALVSYLLFSVPHAIYHFLNLGPYETADAVGNVLTLALTVLAPLWLLVLLARAPAAPIDAATAAAPSDGGDGPRIELVSDRTRNPLARLAFRSSRRREGKVMDPIRVFAHNPTILAGYGAFELASERSRRVPERLKHLASLRAAMLCGCEWCLDYGSAISAAHDVPEDDLRALPVYAESDRFDELERLVLDYASAISRTPSEVPDELFARLRERFDEAQLVELTSVIALENYRARFNWAFGLAGQGYAEGGFCVRPDPGSAAAGGASAWR